MKHELTQEEILVEIKDILLEYVEITRPLTPADRLIDDLGLDSFLIVYFITEIEDCFEIDIPETDFIELVTVKDLCERIQLEIKKHSTYQYQRVIGKSLLIPFVNKIWCRRRFSISRI